MNFISATTPHLLLRFCLIISFQISFVFNFWIADAVAQVNRNWISTFNPQFNYESSAQGIASTPSGTTVTAGVYRSDFFSSKNVLLLTDSAGALNGSDTSTIGFGFKKVLFDGHSHFVAAASLGNDTLPLSKMVIARFDTTFTDRQFFAPDSVASFPEYDVRDMAILENGNIVVASHWDKFPLVCLSLMCVDSTGIKVWEVVDSSFQFAYNVKLAVDSAGGLFVAGSGKDTGSIDDFIFASHYNDSGLQDWTVRYYSPAHIFADMTDLICSSAFLYISGAVMDSTGQTGFLMKIDMSGNIVWKNTVAPLAYSKLLAGKDESIYGFTVPLNGRDAFTIDKLDSSGLRTDSVAFQPSGYFASELGDVQMLHDGIIVLTGGLFVFSFPKSDLFLAAYDAGLNMVGYDIFDSLNLLGENGKAISSGVDGSVYVGGRFNFENQLETSNIGTIKYDFPGLLNTVAEHRTNQFSIFPNPSGGCFTVRCPSDRTGNVTVHFLDMSGRELFTNEIPSSMPEKKYEDIFSPGLYMVVLESSTGRSAFRISIVE